MTVLPRRWARCAAASCALLPAVLPAPAAAATRVVVIEQMQYGAIPPIKVGDTIVFINKDLFRHTVTALNNSFNLDLTPGARGTLRINSPGHMGFYCKYHPGMRGTMVAK